MGFTYRFEENKGVECFVIFTKKKYNKSFRALVSGGNFEVQRKQSYGKS